LKFADYTKIYNKIRSDEDISSSSSSSVIMGEGRGRRASLPTS